MDIEACRRKGGIWDGRNKTCKPPKNIKIFAIIAKVPYGQYVHVIRAKNQSQALDLYNKYGLEDTKGDYKIKKIKTTGFPKYLFHGGMRE